MADLAKSKGKDARNYGVMSEEGVKKVMDKVLKTTVLAYKIR